MSSVWSYISTFVIQRVVGEVKVREGWLGVVLEGHRETDYCITDEGWEEIE